MAAALINARRYRFRSLNNADHNDILDGNEYLVQYIGCTAIAECDDRACETRIEDFFDCVVNKNENSDEKLQFRLEVNRDGVMIRDSEGNQHHSFAALDISSVTTTNSRRYAQYVIIAAKTEQEQTLKGHVLLCKSKSNAESVCHALRKMFKMSSPVTMPTKEEVENCKKNTNPI